LKGAPIERVEVHVFTVPTDAPESDGTFEWDSTTIPVPHKDMLYQAISYKVDPDEADELLQYDGSIILERTKGEIAARCDKEEANFLAINLADDVANGRRLVDDARKFYAESMMAMMKENKKKNTCRASDSRSPRLIRVTAISPSAPWRPPAATRNSDGGASAAGAR